MNLRFTTRNVGIIALVVAAFGVGNLWNEFPKGQNTASAASHIDSSTTIPRELLTDDATILLSYEGGTIEVKIVEVQNNWVKFRTKNGERVVWINADALSARWSVKAEKAK